MDVAALRDAQLDVMAALLAEHVDIDAVLELVSGEVARRPVIASELRG